MAVIYMPQDLREKAWGQAVQNFTNAFFKAKSAKKIRDAYESGTTDPEQLYAMAAGDPDMEEVVDHLLKGAKETREGKVAESAISRNTADVENIHSEIETRQSNEQRAQSLLPGQIALQAAQIRAQNSESALRQAEAAGEPMRIKLLAAQTEQAQAAVRELNQTMGMKQDLYNEMSGGTQQRQEQQDQAGPQAAGYTPLSATTTGQKLGMTAPPPKLFSSAGNTNASFLQNMTADEQVVMKSALAEKGMSGAVAAEKSILKERESASNRKLIQPQDGRAIDGTALMNVSLNQFLDELPQIETGGFAGKLQQIGANYGIDTSWFTGVKEGGRAAFIKANEAADQLKRANATSGGGFMSKERITLAQEVQPGPMKDRLNNLLSSGIAAASELVQTQSMYDRYKNVKPAYALDGIEKQLQVTRETIQRIDHFQVDYKTGAMVDMDRLHQNIPTGEIKTLSGKTVSIDTVRDVMFKLQNESAGARGLIPEDVIKMIIKNY